MCSFLMPYINQHQTEFLQDLGFAVEQQGSQLSISGDKKKVARLQVSINSGHNAIATWENVTKSVYPLRRYEQ